ncbi:MFS transporter [Streptomyces caatingaensis]|uniref:MFS transporter n=1 Tax=Streptomyces caatingaensis TaxID=1678637 RepID=UPI00067285C5|nr:MFS transporter [Streptomyces caatingaensis]
MTRARTTTLLAALYLVQDIAYSFFFLALVVILRRRGVSLEQLALVNLLGLAWAGKFLLAPLVDRFGLPRLGHYRSWLLATQLVTVAALLSLIPLDPAGHLPLVLAVMTVVLLASGAHEVAIGGLAVRLLPPGSRGVAGALQTAAISISMVIGSSGSLLLYEHAGWGVALAVLAAVFALPLALLLRFPEPPAPARPFAPGRAGAAHGLLSFPRRPGAARWMLLVIPLYTCGVYVAEAVVPTMLVDAHWSLSRIALVQGTLGGLAATAAALGAGVVTARVGRGTALLLFGLAQSCALLGLLPLAGGGDTRALAGASAALLTTAVVVAVQALNTAASTAVYTIAMDLSRPGTAATDFAVQVAVLGILRLAANSTGLALAGLLGYLPLIAASSAAAAAGALAAAGWARTHHPRLAAAAAPADNRPATV